MVETLIGSTAGGDGSFLSSNAPGIILLSTSGVVGMIFIMKWLVRFQREFTKFYIDENTKLRAEVRELKKEIESKEEEINSHMMKITECEIKLRSQEAQLDRLNRIVDIRRRSTREDR